jgi:uncharacterized membrane protein YkvA (DUF1232 family)
MISFFFQTLWLFVLAGIGEKDHKSTTEKDAVVAVFMLYAISYNVSPIDLLTSFLLLIYFIGI